MQVIFPVVMAACLYQYVDESDRPVAILVSSIWPDRLVLAVM
jgi:hypothetical protein